MMKKFNERAIREAYEDGDLDEVLSNFLQDRFSGQSIYDLLTEIDLLDRAMKWALERYIEDCREAYDEAVINAAIDVDERENRHV